MKHLGRTFLALLLLLVVGSAEATTRSVVSNVTASGASVVLDTTDTANITLYIKGTWTGTFQFEGRIGAADWFSVEGTPIPASGAVTETTANGTWTVSTALREIRVRSSAFSSGTATVEILAVDAGGGGGGGGGGVAASVTQAGVWTVQPGNTANTTPWLASIAEGGATAQVTATSGGSLQVECSLGCSGGTQYTEGTTSATSIGTALVWKDGSDVMHAAGTGNPLPVTGAVTGPLTDTQLRATPVPVSGPLTDTQLRATPVPVSGTVTVGTFPDNEPFNLAQVAGSAPAATNPLPIRVSNGTAFVDPSAVDAALNTRIVGGVGHDAPASTMDPILGGCYASAAAPADVTADNDATRIWCLRNGSPVYNLAFGGTLATQASLGIGIEDAAETAGAALVRTGTVRRDVAASSADTTGDNATLNTDASGLAWTRTADPCSQATKSQFVVNISSATTTVVQNLDASNKVYLCAVNLVAGAAQGVAVIEDDTSNCTSPTAGLTGGTTGATGWQFAANGGIALGNGAATVIRTTAVNRCLGLVTSTTGQLSGTIQYVLAP